MRFLFYYASVPQHVVEQQYSPFLHLGKEQAVVFVIVFFVGVDISQSDAVGQAGDDVLCLSDMQAYPVADSRHLGVSADECLVLGIGLY